MVVRAGEPRTAILSSAVRSAKLKADVQSLNAVVSVYLVNGGSLSGITDPQEVLNHLKVGEGDTICVTETVDGSLRVGPSNDEFKKQMAAAESVINRYRNTLRELAK